MMAMSLYGSSSGTGGGSPYHPFGPAPGSHKPLTNHLERGSRKLPRPKRSRRKKQKEVSLYPSISAVEEAVPETIISFGDNGTFEINLSSKDDMTDAEAAAAASGNNKDSEQRKEEEVVSSSEESMMTDDEENPLDVHSKPFQRRRYNKKDRSALSLGRMSSNSSQSSMSSQQSETGLNQEFRKLSVKRKPVASAPWPIDDEDFDPLGGIVSTAPRRKVSRHASRDSEHSRGSLGSISCDSDSTGAAPHHRRTATFDSINSEGSSAPSLAELKQQESQYNQQQQKPKKHSRTGNNNKKHSTLSGTSPTQKSKPPFRRMKSWHDDEKSAEKRAQELEIEPGFFLPLRGTDETMAAIKTGFVEEIFCQACDIELICISDASMCVCPECKCVSPVDGIASMSALAKSKYTRGSVGLGLRASTRV
ncbi:expressed unknown protein [Seminavis robusta]|uniref:Uncharacterized protein n=1 Tax=Seminavis robusta TaxID=568900 RepID=A0A9N8DA94_9STRA|nr:expressed unknown protein [Seminavis robusta]|eukprot:Sro55_g032200.1 n/a (421) ;mRNA; r:32359-33621